jgi:hypothetical protein
MQKIRTRLRMRRRLPSIAFVDASTTPLTSLRGIVFVVTQRTGAELTRRRSRPANFFELPRT